jgi:uncharacterized protein
MPGWLPEAVVRPVRLTLYLHGFASSGRSTKAEYFRRHLEPQGVTLTCPDFNEPDFGTMTMTRMLHRLDRELPPAGDGPVAVIGSSLGGALAILGAGRFADRIDRLILLAPAVMFAKPGDPVLPPERVEAWRRNGTLSFFHDAYGEEWPLGFSFYEDSLQYSPFDTTFGQPALVFQGLNDESVNYRTVEKFSNARTNVTLSLLDDDHRLMASLPRMWNDMAPFLGLA